MILVKKLLLFLTLYSIIPSSFSEELISIKGKIIKNRYVSLEFTNSPTAIFKYKVTENNTSHLISAPLFEINGEKISGIINHPKINKTSTLSNGVQEINIEGNLKNQSQVYLKIKLRIAPNSAILRIKYELTGENSIFLTKSNKKDAIDYLTLRGSEKAKHTEIRFSDYNDKAHCYILNELPIEDSYFENNSTVMGPMVVREYNKTNESLLIAYEHGSQYPDDFLNFQLNKSQDITIQSSKGNYLTNQPLDKNIPFETLWFQIGGVKGTKEDLAKHYRDFVLNYLSTNLESRKPYIYYNTWGRQERVFWNGGKYLETMNLSKTLQEIDRAKALGIDVFVIDVGWFLKTGDWKVNTNPEFYPDTLKQVLARLKKYNMKLGLWFNPIVAARSSEMLKKHANSLSTMNGKPKDFVPIWETEESRSICLVSKYWEDYTKELLRLVKDHNMVYVKWDAIDQYGCNDSKHLHGGPEHTEQERNERYGFLLPLYLSKVVEKVNAEYPEVIFDFDITEPGRAVGLSFLASGKYFAINNGPYFHNFDLAETWESPLGNKNANILVNPGPARPWFMRSILTYDKWLPSTLFLTHYQLDGSRTSQKINIASLILGQNGIWGEILKIKENDVSYIQTELEKYKRLKDDITQASPVTRGKPGEHFEVHEKINPSNGKGVVVFFSNGRGKLTYITEHKVNTKFINNSNASIKLNNEGKAIIEVNFEGTDAKIIWFGIN